MLSSNGRTGSESQEVVLIDISYWFVKIQRFYFSFTKPYSTQPIHYPLQVSTRELVDTWGQKWGTMSEEGNLDPTGIPNGKLNVFTAETLKTSMKYSSDRQR